MANSAVKNSPFITLSHTAKNANAYAADSMHTESYNFSSLIPNGYRIMAVRGVQPAGGYFLLSSAWIDGTSAYAIISAKIAIAANTYDITFQVVCCKTELLA